jgi:hypothetical protein
MITQSERNAMSHEFVDQMMEQRPIPAPISLSAGAVMTEPGTVAALRDADPEAGS